MKALRQPLQAVFIAGQRLPVDKNIVAGVFARNHYV